ncbi:MAG: hypothetical protein WA987_15790 [Cellvibrio sp.]
MMTSKTKALTSKEKQYTVLPSETAPEQAFLKANQAVLKALANVKKTKPIKTSK